MAKREQLVEQLRAKQTEIAAIVDAAGDDVLPAEDFGKLKGYTDEAKGLMQQIKQLDEQKGAGDESARMLELLNNPTGVQLPHAAPGEKGASARANGTLKTMGQVVAESEQYKGFMREFAPNGRVNEKGRVQMGAVGVPSKSLLGRKALVTGASDTSAGAFITNDQTGIVVPLTRRPLVMRDMITVADTTSDTVEFVRVTTETNNAAPVAEATATSGTSGTKPESALAFEKDTESVKTIAHWMPATRRALADAAQIRALIDEFLEWGLDDELESQMVAGDGTGENFTGLLNTSGVQTQAWDTDLATTTLKARTKVRTVGRSTPTAYLMNPEDVERLLLEKDANDQYYFGGPAATNSLNPVLWRLPVIEVEDIPAGTGFVGDTRQMVLWDREDAQILVSDSHADFFIRNMIAILAELRAAFTILKPAAFVEIDLTAL